jgi:hypothetical protein
LRTSESERHRNARRAIRAAVAAVTLAAASPAQAEALFEIALDIDHDGKTDRAVLVGREGVGFYAPDRDWFMFGADERAALYIYLGAGDVPLDLARKPSLLKPGIVRGERQNQIFPLKARNGALIITTAYNLYSNWAQETLTIVHRKGAFLVGGFSRGVDMKSGEQGSCDINFLTGKGVAQKGADGKARPLRQRFKPVKLSAWSARSIPKACR